MEVNEMTLDQIWEHCIEMWEWIATQISDDFSDRPRCSAVGVHPLGRLNFVSGLKYQWLNEHNIKGLYNHQDCFFCYRSFVDAGLTDPAESYECECCPGAKVDEGWNCLENVTFYDNPAVFVAELKRLDKIRKDSK